MCKYKGAGEGREMELDEQSEAGQSERLEKDRMVAETDQRFSSLNNHILRGVQACNPGSESFLCEERLRGLSDHYKIDLKSEEVGVGRARLHPPLETGYHLEERAKEQDGQEDRQWQFDGPSWAKEDGTLVTALQLVGEGSEEDSHRQVGHWVSTHGEDGAGPGCCPEVSIQRVLGRERTLNNRTTLRLGTGASMGHMETTRRGGHFEQDTPLQQCAVTRTATFNGTCGDHQTKRTLERDIPLRLCTVARTATFNGTCGDHQTKRTLERDTPLRLCTVTR
ncbi:unnamed protein product [Leuciscus chuanchicus]